MAEQVGPISGGAYGAVPKAFIDANKVAPAKVSGTASLFGVPMPVLTSTFFGAMKGGVINQKIEQMNSLAAQKNAATIAQGMKTQETINRNLQMAEDAHVSSELVIQMNQREAEGAAAAEAASTGASSDQAVREVQRNAAFAEEQADKELQYAADQAEMASWANAQKASQQIGSIEYNPYLNIALSAATTAVPSIYKSGLVK